MTQRRVRSADLQSGDTSSAPAGRGRNAARDHGLCPWQRAWAPAGLERTHRAASVLREGACGPLGGPCSCVVGRLEGSVMRRTFTIFNSGRNNCATSGRIGARWGSVTWTCALPVLLGLSSCTSTGVRVIPAERPNTLTNIGRLDLREGNVVAFGVREAWPCFRDQADQQVAEVCVHPGESFRAAGFNCNEKWTLVEIAEGHAIFDVRGAYYGCTDLFAILFSIPSRTSHWTVVVCPHGTRADNNAEPSSRAHWFHPVKGS